MLARRALALIPLAALGWRCLPGPIDVTGKNCSADRPCGPGYYCTVASPASPNGICEPGAPPPPDNLLLDPSFEDPAPDGGALIPHWRLTGQGRLSRDLVIVFDGSTAALVSSLYDGGAEPRLVADNVLDAGQFQYCATIWVYGVGVGGSTRASIALSARYDGGAFTQSGNSSSLQPVPQWTQLSANIDTTEFSMTPDFLSFSVGTSGLPYGDELVFDDAWLWHPYDGQCP